MRLTNLLLCVLIVIIAATGVAAVVKERQMQHQLREVVAQARNEVHNQQLAIESLGLAVGQLRNEEHAYFEALGLAVGMVRNEQYALWPAVEGHLRDLDASYVDLRNNITAIGSAFGVKHNPQDIDIDSMDNYDELDQNWKSFRDTSNRTKVPCQAEEGTAVIVTLGQSNAANYALALYAPKHDVLNFDLYDGHCYQARDPLLGASSALGNFATPLADMLIERRLYARVIIAQLRDKHRCHFNAAGLLRHAAMWADVLQAWADSKGTGQHEAAER